MIPFPLNHQQNTLAGMIYNGSTIRKHLTFTSFTSIVRWGSCAHYTSEGNNTMPTIAMVDIGASVGAAVGAVVVVAVVGVDVDVVVLSLGGNVVELD